jgi:uncharacterized protein YihD (DUF1040 family)
MGTRDPARIDEMLEYLRRCWIHKPDTRLSQLIVSVANTGEAMPGLFYMEDDKMLRRLKQESERLSKEYLNKE